MITKSNVECDLVSLLKCNVVGITSAV